MNNSLSSDSEDDFEQGDNKIINLDEIDVEDESKFESLVKNAKNDLFDMEEELGRDTNVNIKQKTNFFVSSFSYFTVYRL